MLRNAWVIWLVKHIFLPFTKPKIYAKIRSTVKGTDHVQAMIENILVNSKKEMVQCSNESMSMRKWVNKYEKNIRKIILSICSNWGTHGICIDIFCRFTNSVFYRSDSIHY